MCSSVKIRKGCLADLDEIVAIESICFAEDSFSRRQLAYLIQQAKGIFYVAESDNRIAGYISLLKRTGSNLARIYSIVVHPDVQGKRIGQKLMNKSIEYAKNNNVSRLSLEVRTDNLAALKLYRKNGFETTSLIKNYYADGSDAWQMKANI